MMLDFRAKVMDQEAFLAVRQALPKDFTLVFTNGCFDILHPGHVDLLTRARELGDGLVVGLNTDDSVRRLGKEGDRPVNPEVDRALVLAGLACVDWVVPFDEDTPLELITAVRPNVLVKGGDWSVETIVGREIVQGDRGRVVSLPLLPGHSTTALLQKILDWEKKS